MSIFRRSKSKTQLSTSSGSSSSPAPPLPPLKTTPPHLAHPPAQQTNHTARRTSSQSFTPKHVDDFGRVLDRPTPAFGQEGAPVVGFDPFAGDPFGTEGEGTEGKEFALLYGYAPIGTEVELSVERVAELCERCGEQIRTRG